MVFIFLNIFTAFINLNKYVFLKRKWKQYQEFGVIQWIWYGRLKWNSNRKLLILFSSNWWCLISRRRNQHQLFYYIHFQEMKPFCIIKTEAIYLAIQLFQHTFKHNFFSSKEHMFWSVIIFKYILFFFFFKFSSVLRVFSNYFFFQF